MGGGVSHEARAPRHSGPRALLSSAKHHPTLPSRVAASSANARADSQGRTCATERIFKNGSAVPQNLTQKKFGTGTVPLSLFVRRQGTNEPTFETHPPRSYGCSLSR